MPAFAFHFEKVYSPVEPYDPQTTPSKVGLISETFRSMKDVQRSGHPTHSAAAWGALAEELIACDWSPDDTRSLRAMMAAAARGAKVLMIGCDFTSLSLLHAAEELADAPYIKIFCERHLGWKPSACVKDVRGRPRSVALVNVPGCSRAFGKAQSLAKRRKLLREGRFGQAACLVFDAQAVLDATVAQLRQKPDFLLCRAGTCRDCDDRRVALELSSPDAAEIIRFTIDILADCGCRLAGGDGERLAAERIARRMHEIGLDDVTIHRFPISAWRPGFSRFEVRDGRRWNVLESAPVSHSPSTGGKTIRGRLVHLECLAGLDKIGDPRGAIAVLWDGYGDSFDEFRRLMAAGFAAIIMIDRRFTHEDVVAEGVPSRWLDAFTTPMITLPHPAAARWFSHGADGVPDQNRRPRRAGAIDGRHGRDSRQNRQRDFALRASRFDVQLCGPGRQSDRGGRYAASGGDARAKKTAAEPHRPLLLVWRRGATQRGGTLVRLPVGQGKKRPARVEQRFRRCSARHDARLRSRRRGTGRMVSRRGPPLGDAVQSRRGIESLQRSFSDELPRRFEPVVFPANHGRRASFPPHGARYAGRDLRRIISPNWPPSRPHWCERLSQADSVALQPTIFGGNEKCDQECEGGLATNGGSVTYARHKETESGAGQTYGAVPSCVLCGTSEQKTELMRQRRR